MKSAGLAVLLCVLGVACGHRTELPQESGGGVIPPSNTYVVKQVWEGFEGAEDLVLTSGRQLFVAFPGQGEVVGYFSTGVEPRPNGKVLAGRGPYQVAEGPDRTLIVADTGDAGEAVVRVYSQADGTEQLAFTDPEWQAVGGVAADDDGFIYVSDRVTDRVRKYSSAGGLVMELAEGGSGRGFVQAPNGLDWQPNRILVVDAGKQWVQGLSPTETNVAELLLNGNDTPFGAFAGLADVAGDGEGNQYVVDSTHAAVWKFDVEGAFEQRVDQNTQEGDAGFLREPIAVSANDVLAYVLDRMTGKVVTFELDR